MEYEHTGILWKWINSYIAEGFHVPNNNNNSFRFNFENIPKTMLVSSVGIETLIIPELRTSLAWNSIRASSSSWFEGDPSNKSWWQFVITDDSNIVKKILFVSIDTTSSSRNLNDSFFINLKSGKTLLWIHLPKCIEKVQYLTLKFNPTKDGLLQRYIIVGSVNRSFFSHFCNSCNSYPAQVISEVVKVLRTSVFYDAI